MSTYPPGRTTRDGDLPLEPKVERPEPAANPVGGGAPPADHGGGYGGGGYGGGDGYGGTYAQLDPLATASLVCGVLGIVFICCCGLFTLMLAPLAVILGIVSLVRIKNNPETLSGVGMAWAGIITGALSFGFYLLYFLFVGGVQLLSVLEQM
jgi:hypothetical protein